MDILLKENERIDDLEYKGLKIIQNKKGFCFGMDSVLLSDYAKSIKKDSMVLDLGTGTGILGILLCGKTKLKHITGIEIQEEVFDMAKRSISLNNLKDRFDVLNEDIKEISKIFPAESIDAIVTNPPYKQDNTGLHSKNETQLISRHEIKCTLEDVIKISAKLLKNSGEFYMVHRPERVADIVDVMRKYKLEPKNIRFVFPKTNKEPNLLLIKAVKNANSFLKVESPLIIYKEDGEYTEELLKIYNKE